MKHVNSARKPRFNLVVIYFAAGIIAIALLLYVAHREAYRMQAHWPQAPAEILGERSVLQNVYEGHPGGGVIYQGEVEASYYAEGRHFESWIPVLRASEDRALLASELHTLASKSCTVRWEPGRPQDPALVC